jgi:glucose/arabinose dehydrogenase
LYTATEEPFFRDGKYGESIEVDAKKSSSIILADQIQLNPSGFSVSFWVEPSKDYDRLGDIISYTCRKCFPPSGWYFDILGNLSSHSIRFGLYNSTGGLHTTDEIAVPSETYTHLVGVFDGSNIKLFKNGKIAAETPIKGVYDNTNNVRAGADFYGDYSLKVGTGSYCNACFLWTGSVDDLQIYNKALTEKEVRQTYAIHNKNYLLNDSNSNSNNNDSSIINYLIGYWMFDGNLNDSTKNNKAGFVDTLIASMVFAPDGRLFFTEKNTGNIRIMKNNQVLDTPFVTVTDLYVDAEQGLLGLTIDPKFEQNGFVYLYYTYLDKNSEKPFNRVVRFTDINNTATNRVTILNNILAVRGFHSGGALAFGPDDKLYISVGDATNSIYAQNPFVLLGKVLRINRDGTIPKDNPYHNSPVYNIGHRNMYGIAFNNAGFGLVTENGANLYDEIDTIEKGGNYGYPTLQPPDIAPELDNSSYGIKPLRSYRSVIGPTQAIFYTGDKIPELKNKFLFGSINGKIYSLDIANDKKQIIEERIELRNFPFEGAIGLAQSPSGDLYYGGYSIYKLDALDISNKVQSVFPIHINHSSFLNANLINIISNIHQNNNNDIRDEGGDQLGNGSNENLIALNLNISISGNGNGRSNSNNMTENQNIINEPSLLFLDISIPRGIMEEVTKIMLTDASNSSSSNRLEYSQELSDDDNGKEEEENENDDHNNNIKNEEQQEYELEFITNDDSSDHPEFHSIHIPLDYKLFDKDFINMLIVGELPQEYPNDSTETNDDDNEVDNR